MTHYKISVANDRIVSFEDYGDLGLDPVLLCHGGPGSRVSPGPVVRGYQEAGFRPIGIDRPGYGETSPWLGRSIGDWTRDGLAAADHLALESFFVVGSSTGASYALALAAAVPERVPGVVICCGMSDQRWADKVEDARMDLADDFWFARDREAAIAAAEALYGPRGERQHERGPDGREIWSPPDQAVILGGARQAADPENTPFAQGVIGYADDRIADGPAHGWQSFDVARVRCPVILVHGEQDWIVPLAQARHTASLLAKSELRTYPEHGHLSVGVEALQALVDVRARSSGRG
jgi:pimeloyl-ACP methyl ester carboxylesterase